MEAEIVFCERCGVSIPEPEVAGAREATGGRDLCTTCRSGGPSAPGDLQLYFCENCRVSIAVSDVLTGQARPEGAGYHCSVCSVSTPEQRQARRTAVEREMEDEIAAAPIPVPVHESPPAHQPAAPLYFCEACNASIPAAAVATGHALVEGGRTWCERCRPRAAVHHHHAGTGGGGAGVVPVFAAALLAAAATAGAFVLWERIDRQEQAAGGPAAKDREVADLRSDLRALRTVVETARAEDRERDERALRDETRIHEQLRGEMAAAVKAGAGGAAPGANPERVAILEERMKDLEEQMGTGFQALAEKIERLADAGPAMTAAAPPAADPPPRIDPLPEMPPAREGPGQPSPDALRLMGLLKDKAAETRFSAAIELGKLGEKSVWQSLVEALKADSDPFVRRACCRSLGELKAYDSVPALIEALGDGEEYVAKQASMVLRDMSGQDFGYKQNQTKSDRKKVSDKAKKWWEENKAKLLGM